MSPRRNLTKSSQIPELTVTALQSEAKCQQAGSDQGFSLIKHRVEPDQLDL